MKTKITLFLVSIFLSLSSFATITVLSPNGGEVWAAGSTQTITWKVTGISLSMVPIYYSTNNGSSWNLVVASTANTGSYNWTVPNTPSTQCLVRVGQGNEIDQSDAVFTITGSTGISAPGSASASVSFNSAAGTLLVNQGNVPLNAVEIYDITGRTVKQVTAAQLSAGNTIIYLSTLPAGVYLVVLREAEGILTKKITVQ